MDEDGTVTPAELKAGLQALNSLLSKHGSPMSSAQIAAVASHLDRNDDGRIDYQDNVFFFFFSTALCITMFVTVNHTASQQTQHNYHGCTCG